MSSQRGNVSRSRPQKYQNKTSFKNDRYDKTLQTQVMNSLVHEGLCQRCKAQIEWKIKYKKYKALTQPSTCIICKNKSVKRAYHKVCQPCAQKTKVCEKCNEKKDIVLQPGPSEDEKRAEEAATKFELMQLPERKRRAVLRFIEKGGTLEEAGISKGEDNDDDDFLDDYFKDSENEEEDNDSDEDEDKS